MSKTAKWKVKSTNRMLPKWIDILNLFAVFFVRHLQSMNKWIGFSLKMTGAKYITKWNRNVCSKNANENESMKDFLLANEKLLQKRKKCVGYRHDTQWNECDNQSILFIQKSNSTFVSICFLDLYLHDGGNFKWCLLQRARFVIPVFINVQRRFTNRCRRRRRLFYFSISIEFRCPIVCLCVENSYIGYNKVATIEPTKWIGMWEDGDDDIEKRKKEERKRSNKLLNETQITDKKRIEKLKKGNGERRKKNERCRER